MAVRRAFAHRGMRLEYEEYGEGSDLVVMTHGLLLDAGINRIVAERLADHGYRVVLLDLAGHGGSDKPHHASFHRMDGYADQVLALLDELDVASAVIGGVSLGANVSLFVAARAPWRVRALVIEMPVLERAAPAAHALFVPLLLAVHYGHPFVRALASGLRALPATGSDLVDSALRVVSGPEEMASVLHGLLVGPLAPTLEQRRAIEVPALIIGHQHDLLHPFQDADHLARQLPAAQLIRARSFWEMRLRPSRLVGVIGDFLAGLERPAPATAAR